MDRLNSYQINQFQCVCFVLVLHMLSNAQQKKLYKNAEHVLLNEEKFQFEMANKCRCAFIIDFECVFFLHTFFWRKKLSVQLIALPISAA